MSTTSSISNITDENMTPIAHDDLLHDLVFRGLTGIIDFERRALESCKQAAIEKFITSG
ncbi:hypothetical protein [Oceanobacillus saliphilus]|uniref:hypothetical protein n=1 Tax=Oceanobacillus saliphilus TaxID=2925834 RepID=UPI00201DE584|nr:hypothetical protein [Oceanobacillus saliphilus]